MNNEVVASKPRRKMKPRKKWKRYQRTGQGELLTEERLARRLDESQITVRKWRLKGLIPCIVLGHRTIRYQLDDVLAALSKRRVK